MGFEALLPEDIPTLLNFFKSISCWLSFHFLALIELFLIQRCSLDYLLCFKRRNSLKMNSKKADKAALFKSDKPQTLKEDEPQKRNQLPGPRPVHRLSLNTQNENESPEDLSSLSQMNHEGIFTEEESYLINKYNQAPDPRAKWLQNEAQKHEKSLSDIGPGPLSRDSGFLGPFSLLKNLSVKESISLIKGDEMNEFSPTLPFKPKKLPPIQNYTNFVAEKKTPPKSAEQGSREAHFGLKKQQGSIVAMSDSSSQSSSEPSSFRISRNSSTLKVIKKLAMPSGPNSKPEPQPHRKNSGVKEEVDSKRPEERGKPKTKENKETFGLGIETFREINHLEMLEKFNYASKKVTGRSKSNFTSNSQKTSPNISILFVFQPNGLMCSLELLASLCVFLLRRAWERKQPQWAKFMKFAAT